MGDPPRSMPIARSKIPTKTIKPVPLLDFSGEVKLKKKSVPNATTPMKIIRAIVTVYCIRLSFCLFQRLGVKGTDISENSL